MARTLSASARRIAIEDEVWDEAFSTRVPSARRRSAGAPGRSPRPSGDRPTLRQAQGPEDGPRLRLAEPVEPAVSPEGRSRPRYEPDVQVSEGRRTIRIQGRGADPYRSAAYERSRPSSTALPRTLRSSPDRLAMWATLLGFLLVLVAVLSSHF